MKLSEIHIRDPFIFPFNGKYYMYGTRGNGNAGCGFDVYISEDLESWSEPISVFEASENFWGKMQFWAPEVHFYNGKFYMFASFKADNVRRASDILVSEAPDKPFVPNTDKPITPADWECLDGTLYIDKAGEPYMVFCHEWVQIHNGEMCAVKLSRDLKEPIGDPILLFRASEPVWSRKDTEDFVTDGPFMYRTSDGRLLMIWSSFNSNGYVEAVAYSDNGEITGKWNHCDKPLFEKDGGHGMIFDGFDGEKYFVCHAPNISPDERPVLRKIIERNGMLQLGGGLN